MKCELKYIKHDFIEKMQQTTLKILCVAVLIACIVSSVSNYLFGDIGIWIVVIIMWISIPILGWKEAVEYCINKKIID